MGLDPMRQSTVELINYQGIYIIQSPSSLKKGVGVE